MGKYCGGLVLIIVVGFSACSLASSSEPGNISLIQAMSNGAVIFYHDGARNNEIPSCGQNFSSRWVINSTYTGGNTQVSVLLSAHAQGKKISIVGTGGCDIWSDTETVEHLVVRD